MKRVMLWCSMVLIVMGFVVGCGGAGQGEKGSKMLYKPLHKDAMGFQGPVKKVITAYERGIEEYQYSQNGVLKEYWLVIEEVNSIKTVKYDDQERQYEFIRMTMDRKPKFRLDTKYDEKKKTFVDTATIEGKSVIVSEGLLDDKGRILERRVSVNEFERYEYDERGNEIRYTENKKRMKETQYDSKNREISEKNYVWNSVSNKFDIEEEGIFSFNDLKEKTREFIKYKDQKPLGKRIIKYDKYEYDKYGNWIRRTVVRPDEKAIIEIRTITYYE